MTSKAAPPSRRHRSAVIACSSGAASHSAHNFHNSTSNAPSSQNSIVQHEARKSHRSPLCCQSGKTFVLYGSRPVGDVRELTIFVVFCRSLCFPIREYIIRPPPPRKSKPPTSAATADSSSPRWNLRKRRRRCLPMRRPP